MSLTKLLAAPELIGTELGKIMHKSGKKIIRSAVSRMHSHYIPVLEYKKEHGWIKDHVLAEREAFEFVDKLYLLDLNRFEFAGGYTGRDDPRRILLWNIVDLITIMQDEDSAYDLPILLMMKWVHEHWDRFEKSAEQAYQLMSFPVLYEDALALTAPLPLDDGTDIEEDTIDYVASEKKLMGEINGMGNKS